MTVLTILGGFTGWFLIGFLGMGMSLLLDQIAGVSDRDRVDTLSSILGGPLTVAVCLLFFLMFTVLEAICFIVPEHINNRYKGQS